MSKVLFFAALQLFTVSAFATANYSCGDKSQYGLEVYTDGSIDLTSNQTPTKKSRYTNTTAPHISIFAFNLSKNWGLDVKTIGVSRSLTVGKTVGFIVIGDRAYNCKPSL